jgi:hypothetical protein
MDKIDLVVLTILYLLQIASILLHLYLNHGARLYNYWCNTINNQALCKDIMRRGTFFLLINHTQSVLPSCFPQVDCGFSTTNFRLEPTLLLAATLPGNHQEL